MTTMTLKNGNIVIINSLRYTYNKCIFSYTIFQKDGNWKHTDIDSYTIGYYESIEEYINNNF